METQRLPLQVSGPNSLVCHKRRGRRSIILIKSLDLVAFYKEQVINAVKAKDTYFSESETHVFD